VTTVKFFDPDYIPDIKLTYSVIVARYDGRWMFVRHHDRATWEIAETILMDTLPENLTYPDIQPHLFKKVIEFLKSRERIL